MKHNEISTEKAMYAIGAAIVLFIAYQAFVAVPQKNAQLKIDAERQEQLDKEAKYSSCNTEAYTAYSMDWDAACGVIGLSKDCVLPGYRIEPINSRWDEAKDRCVALYK